MYRKLGSYGQGDSSVVHTDMGSVQELMGHGLDVEEAPMASGIDQNLTIDDWKVEIVRRR
jgi:hypothetical protein